MSATLRTPRPCLHRLEATVPAGLEHVQADLMLKGYGERPEELSWYLATAILCRWPHPFRHQDQHWPERIEEMVRAAERVDA